jgi:3-deoxy-D-arabino-heptulosonate 7-phosphate (DAHP) synthase
VEAHPAPEKTVSDGARSPDLAQFQKMMDELKPHVALWQRREEGK